MRRMLIATAACALVLAAAVPAVPAGSLSEINSLKGVYPIRVAVSQLRPDVISDGMTQARLKQIMEARLKQSGVPVSGTATNDLLLTVTTSPQTNGTYAVHLHLEVQQLVALFHEYVRDPESRGMAATWRTSWIGIVKTDELKNVEPELVKLVDQFIADWRIGNRGRTRGR